MTRYYVLLLLVFSTGNFLTADINRSPKNRPNNLSDFKVQKLPQKSYMVEGNRTTDIQKRADFEEKRITLCLLKINEFLTSKGFKTENVAFQMKFRNLLKFKYKNKAFLNGERLPENISAEIFKIYNDTCKMIRTRPINIPHGINSYLVGNELSE